MDIFRGRGDTLDKILPNSACQFFLNPEKLMSELYKYHFQKLKKQECIPVACVPPAAVAVTGGGLHPLARSPSTSPLGVGLEIPPGTRRPPVPGIPPLGTRHTSPGTRHPPVDGILDTCL